MTAGLYLVATPIGNLGDLTARAAAVLRAASRVAAEDPDRARALLAHLGIATPRITGLSEGAESQRADVLVDAAAGGEVVALVVAAGSPAISDPGYRVVAAAVARGVPIVTVPGPSAVVAALQVSGLPTDRFTFVGFLPRKAGARDAALTELANRPETLVFYESPRRLAPTLDALASMFGGWRRAVVARELTKMHETVTRGTLAELAASVREPVRGEVTLVVAGAPPVVADEDAGAQATRDVSALVAAGLSRRDAATAVAVLRGLPRRLVYQVALDTPDDSTPSS
jgi:16S rRNA (cytidine1402-2'-O)-methyltransferase